MIVLLLHIATCKTDNSNVTLKAPSYYTTINIIYKVPSNMNPPPNKTTTCEANIRPLRKLWIHIMFCFRYCAPVIY